MADTWCPSTDRSWRITQVSHGTSIELIPLWCKTILLVLFSGSMLDILLVCLLIHNRQYNIFRHVCLCSTILFFTMYVQVSCHMDVSNCTAWFLIVMVPSKYMMIPTLRVTAITRQASQLYWCALYWHISPFYLKEQRTHLN